MHIKTDTVLTVTVGQASFTARPDMGVIKHFPTPACLALIKLGAVEAGKKASSKEVAGDSASTGIRPQQTKE